MINTDTALQNALAYYERYIQTKIYVNDSTTPITSGITDCSITEQGFSEDTFTIGEFNTNSLSLTAYTDEIDEDSILTIYQSIRVGDEWVDILMGTFYIESIERTDGSALLQIKGYDISYKLGETYISNITTFPTTAKAVVDDICTQYGLSYTGLTVGSYAINAIYDCTVKEMLSYIAQLQCSNIKINRNGVMEFYWYEDSGYTITRDLQTLGGFKKTSDAVCRIDGINCTVEIDGEETTITVGTGVLKTINISNPYMTEAQLTTVFNVVNGFEYTPCEIDYRGNPTLEIGDIVYAVDAEGNTHTVLLSEHSLNLLAMSGSITCKYANDISNSVSFSPTQGKINAVYSFVERLYAQKAEVEELYAKKAEIDNLYATKAEVQTLEANMITTDVLDAKVAELDTIYAKTADIEDVYATKAEITSLSAVYANVDFANITDLAVENLLSGYGVINNLVIDDGYVSGSLNAVTVNGDLIEAGTLKTDQLYILGDDGNYYQLNASELGVSVSVADTAKIHGDIIIAKSLTAEQIYVEDLVAFGATIGGFNITENSIYSGVKNSVNNTTSGIYLGADGQVSIGNETDYLRFYDVSSGEWKLEISASSVDINVGSDTTTVQDAVNGVYNTVSEWEDYLSITNNALVIGNGNNSSTFDSSGLTVSVNGSDNSTTITADGVTTTTLTADIAHIGNYMFQEESNGSLSIMYVGS